MTVSILIPIVAIIVGIILFAWNKWPWVGETGRAFLWAGAFALVFMLARASLTVAAHLP